jgi:hypothetical protein
MHANHSLGIVCPRFHNPADFFINQISIVPTKQEASMARLKMLWDAYEGSALCAQNGAWRKELPDAVLKAKHKPVSMKHFHASTSTQFYYTMRRNIQNEFRRILDVKARFANAVVMGFILGIIYYGQTDSQQSAKNIMGLFFLLIMFQTMVSMFGVLQAFPSEVKVFMRENLSGANRYVSKQERKEGRTTSD